MRQSPQLAGAESNGLGGKLLDQMAGGVSDILAGREPDLEKTLDYWQGLRVTIWKPQEVATWVPNATFEETGDALDEARNTSRRFLFPNAVLGGVIEEVGLVEELPNSKKRIFGRIVLGDRPTYLFVGGRSKLTERKLERVDIKGIFHISPDSGRVRSKIAVRDIGPDDPIEHPELGLPEIV